MATSEAIRVTLLMNRAVNRAVRTYLQRSFQELIDKTPVRTGFAQSNWLVAVGTAPEDVQGSQDNVDYGPQQQSFRVIRQYKPGDGELVIYNNVPYIGKLNEGSSTQAPAGFVDEILERIAKEVDRIVLV